MTVRRAGVPYSERTMSLSNFTNKGHALGEDLEVYRFGDKLNAAVRCGRPVVGASPTSENARGSIPCHQCDGSAGRDCAADAVCPTDAAAHGRHV
eukprot:s2796_g8.t1